LETWCQQQVGGSGLVAQGYRTQAACETGTPIDTVDQNGSRLIKASAEWLDNSGENQNHITWL
jgi:hypothetical protein